MTPEELRAEMEKAGLHLSKELIQQLLPLRQRWGKYLEQAREIDLEGEEPAHIFCPKHW